MEPTISIPLHFSLEFLGVAALGGLLAWALQARRRLLSALVSVQLAVQALHAGQFVSQSTASRALSWASASLAAAVAAAGRREEDHPLWVAAWAPTVAGSLALAAGGPHTAGLLSAKEAALHGVVAVGYLGMGAWAWRRTRRSVRLRLLGGFAAVLFVSVMVAGGSVARVVASNLQDEELRRLRVQARAQREVVVQASDDLVRRARFLADNISSLIASGRLRGIDELRSTVGQVLADAYPDVDLIAILDPGRREMVRAGDLDPAAAAVVGGSRAVAAALVDVPSASIERVPGGVVMMAAAPVFPAGPRTVDRVAAVAVLARLEGAARLGTVQAASGLAAAFVSPAGDVIASSDRALRRATLPPPALERLAAGEVWSGSLAAGGGRFFASVAPMQRGDGTVPAGLLLASPDTVLARTTLRVSQALFGAVLAATLLAVLIAVWLGSRISRPIVDLTATAARVEAGDLAAAAAVRTPDEIGRLARAFNEMTSSLRQTIASEQEARTQLQTIVTGMGEGLVAMDADYRIVTFNPAAEAITGIKASDAIGRICHEVYGRLTAGPGRRTICDYLCPLRHGGGSDLVGLRARGGRDRTVAVTCSTLRDDQGRVVGGVDLLRDVTEEQEAQRMKETFLANTSHELRTPLTAIRGFADLMLRREFSRTQQLEFLSSIVEATQRLERMASMLVDVAELEGGRREVKLLPVPPTALVKEAAERWRDRSPRHEVETVLARGLPDVGADVELVGRALDELIDNAIKFSPNGGRVTLGARARDGHVELWVADEGIGISRAERARLFEAFVQADASATRSYGGLGLGLAFVRRIVEAHGGRLEVRSRPGQGSTFSFFLPAWLKPPPRGSRRRTA